jgi:hypothetical protein
MSIWAVFLALSVGFVKIALILQALEWQQVHSHVSGLIHVADTDCSGQAPQTRTVRNAV